MQRIDCRCILLVVLGLFAIGCSGGSGVEPPGSDGCDGEVTSLGSDLGTTATASIGPAGGVLQSADGRARLTIPAGALSGSVTLRIDGTANTAPLGAGNGVRISVTPAATLQMPITLTLRYDASDLEGTVASALGIASESKSTLIWDAVGVTRSRADSTMSVSLSAIDGESRWAMYAAFAMRSDDSPVVMPGATYSASMYVQPNIAKLDTLGPGGRVVLCAPVTSTTAVDARLETGAAGGGGGAAGGGSGSVSHNGGTATYTAPPEIPDDPWLAVLLRWPSGYHWGSVEVYNYVWVGGVVEFTLDGKSYSWPLATAIVYSSRATGSTNVTGMSRAGEAPVGVMGFSFKLADVGTYRMLNSGDSEHDDMITATIGDKSYYTYYYECVGSTSELRWTDLGTVTVTVANRDRRYISGTFSGTIAALDGTKSYCGPFEQENWKLYPIHGTFRGAWGIL